MPTFNTGLPSIRQIQTLIREKTQVEIKLVTADLLEGQIRWQDENCLCLVDAHNQSTILYWHGIAYIKAKS